MGVIAQPPPCRLGLPNAAAQVSPSRCSNHSSSIASLRQTRNARQTTFGVRQAPQASRLVTGGVLLQPVRRHLGCRAASADEQPAPSEEARGASAQGNAQLQQQVASFGEAVAQSERDAFLAAQDQLRQQQADQPRQQAVGAQTMQGGAAILAQDGRSNVATDAAAAAAAATFGGAPPASPPATAPAELPFTASGSQQPEAAAPQAATGGAGKLDMAAAVRDKLARAAEYRKVACFKVLITCAIACSQSRSSLLAEELALCMTPRCCT